MPDETSRTRSTEGDEPPAVRRLQLGPGGAGDEERLVEPDGAQRAHRRVHSPGDERLGLAPELRTGAYSQLASSFVQYEMTRSAPARRIAVSDSSAAVRSSRCPARAASFTIAYSPETL